MDPGTQDNAAGTDAPSWKYDAAVTESQGAQIGDGGIQVNLFGGRKSAGCVAAGNVPQPPPAFQAREDLMSRLREAGPGVSVVRAITGMRGVGKTQLAAAYARECIDTGWRLVAWINAEDIASVLAGLEVVANRLGIDRSGTALEAIGAEVRNRVEADGDRCLIVYDNVTDPDALRPYIPSAGKSQVVVTSTQASAVELGKSTQVTVFTERESDDFLTERTGLNDVAGAKRLATELGRLPLALAQAAAVIKARHLSYEVYLARLRAYPAQKYLPPARGDLYPRGVAESILLSIDTVTAAGETDLCADLLGVISLLSADGVPRDLLYLGEPEDIFAASAEALDEALARLADASLLTFGGGDETDPAVSAHRLVMRVVHERRAHDGTLLSVGARTCALLSAAAGSLGAPWQRREVARDLVQQVLALNDHLAPHLAGDPQPLTEALLLRRGWALWCLNDLGDSAEAAIKLGGDLVADYARVLGDDHPGTMMSTNNLAAAHQAAGHVAEAIPLYERTLADRVRVLGDDHPDTLTSQNNLATAYDDAGRVDEAIPLYERTLADSVRVLGDDHPDTLTSQNNLATAYDDAGRVAVAIPLLERTLADRVRVLGEDHPSTLMSQNNLAMAYWEAGRAGEAIWLLEEASAGFERAFGAEHPSTVLVRENLAIAREEARLPQPQSVVTGTAGGERAGPPAG
jgi:tetratricopeptide (TPR) repeat protein